MIKTLDGVLVQTIASFPTRAIEEFVVSEHVGREDALSRVTFELGLGFQDCCLDITETDIPAGAIQIVSFSKLVSMEEARAIVGYRWKPVSLCGIFELINHADAAKIIRKVSTTYFPVRHHVFEGIVFATELGLNNWYLDAALETEIMGISALDVDCQFGISTS